MEEKKISEKVFDVAAEFEEQLVDIVDDKKRAEIKDKIDRLFDLAIEIEKRELEANKLSEKEVNYVFEEFDEEEKVEIENTISAHLKNALDLLKEKGKNKSRDIENKTKGIMNGIGEKINSMYNSSIEFVDQKREETKLKIATKKEERRELREQAIEQLKELGKEDEFIEAYQNEAEEIREELDTHYEEQDEIKDNEKQTKKNAKALTKYEKKGFLSRFLSNFSDLGKTENLSEEQKKDMMENGGVPKKIGFFSKVKQAFTKTKAQNKEIQDKNDAIKEDIMQKFEEKFEEKNKEINELENILIENEEQRDALEAERKEKLIEIVKTGKLKAKELQEMIDNEILVCSDPKMIVAQAKVSTLKDKLSRVLSWGKEKEVEKSPEEENKTVERNSGIDR